MLHILYLGFPVEKNDNKAFYTYTALGLHNLTVNSKLGHCIDYNLLCDIETAQANKAQVMASRSSILPLKPRSEKYLVDTWFWVDNFNENVETVNGGGAVNITTLMAFQEPSENAFELNEIITIPKTKQQIIENPEANTEVIVAERLRHRSREQRVPSSSPTWA